MARLHATYFKLVNAGGDLDAATQRSIVDNDLELNAEGVVVEHIISSNPSPVERYEIGTKITGKFVMIYDDENDALDVLGGSLVSSVYTKAQGTRTLAKKDMRFGIIRTSDHTVIPMDITDVNLTPKMQLKFKQGSRTYLPCEFMGTSTSDLTIDNS